MKEIYLTKEGKQEIEAKIKELDRLKREPDAILTFNEYQRIIDVYKEILQSATILPVEESFYTVENKLNFHCGKTGCSKDGAIFKEYQNGVIIQPKQ
jgi:hypothetical protein